jgi:hypothetical protein
MFVADKDLRDRAAIAARNHFLARFLIFFDIDFAENDLLLLQQAFGSLAVRTPIRHVNGDNRRRHFELLLLLDDFVSGKLSFTQALSPPWRLNTLAKPSFIKVRAALAPSAPLSQ